MTKDKKYLKRAELELNAVSKFDNWNPTHYLDVGEMTMAVAIGYDWLFDNLQLSTKENIRKAFGNNHVEAGLLNRPGRVFAAGATTKVSPG